MKKTILAAAAVTLALAGCNSKEEAKSVEYYKAHENERQAKYKECDNRIVAALEKGDVKMAEAIEEEVGCKNAKDAMSGGRSLFADEIDDTNNQPAGGRGL
jgi:uncharacterized lipoprotein NlpE involved in copper resistance